MWFVTVFVVLLASALALVPEAGAAPTSDRSSAAPAKSSFMRVHRATLPPYGYVRFCREAPSECRAGRLEDQRIEATPSRLTELDVVNRHVNRIIEPATDEEIYGEVERWIIPRTRGDCEDYALLKRQMLMQRGWPASALLMTVVRDEKGEGHAVLTARTSKGDFILDNKTSDMKIWHETPYRYVMRQSYIDPNVWLSLDPGEALPTLPVAGTRDGP